MSHGNLVICVPHGVWDCQKCAKHDAPWILPVSGPLTSADVAALRASHQRLKEALEWIVRVSAMDYEYREKAREALRSAP